MPSVSGAAKNWMSIGRRELLLAAIICTGTWLLTDAADGKARRKVSKQLAEYQDAPKDVRMCATCSLFLAPQSCEVVVGRVNPNGWCKFYALAD
jgi:hypothetical protein